VLNVSLPIESIVTDMIARSGVFIYPYTELDT
jgi:hypothetical protein